MYGGCEYVWWVSKCRVGVTMYGGCEYVWWV